ncbi:MAG: ATP-binding protein [Bacteroidota bacterium]
MARHKIYIRAVMISVGVILFNQAFIQFWLYQKTQDGLLINISGRQRMYSQRLLAQALAYEKRPNLEMREVLTEWQQAHKDIEKRIGTGFRFYRRTRNLKDLQKLQPQIERAAVYVKRLETDKPVNWEEFELNQESYLLQMDAIVSNLQEDADRKLILIIVIEILLTLLSLGIIYFEINFIFKRIFDRLQNRNQALKTSNEVLEQYAYLASHDLKAPIQNILNFTNVLQKKLAGKLDPKETEYMGYVYDASKRMKQTTDDLLTFASLQEIAPNTDKLSPDEVLTAVRQDLADLITKYDAQIDVQEMPESIQADRHILHLVFQNLISNGIKYGGANGSPKIDISYRLEPNHHCFAIQDNGAGIDQDDQKRIFKLFTRLDQDGKTKGTGIGLTIAQHMLRKLKGKLQVHSEPDKGSVFFVRLPIEG